MTDSPTPKSNGRSSDMIGQQVGNYVIESLLGVGGMGQVFKARHVLLDRPVALKLMHANLAKDPAFQARFLQEARSAGALRHPHIVEVFDFDEQDGYAYLVMELVTGGSLRNLLQDAGRGSTDWSLERGLDLVRQAADALAYAHALGMVHRDIKPDNLLLQHAPQGGPPILKVGDFGLARLGEGSGLTAANTAMGTPAYMSPEQCQGQDLDGRSDIYALGVVLYEVATGTLPFSIKTVSEAVFKHVYTTPTSPRQLRPDLPEALDALIMRCLAKLPSERFASAADLSAALRELTSSLSPNSAVGSMLYSVPMVSTQGGQGTAIGQMGGAAPDVGSLPGAASLPRIQVLDEAGTLLQVVAIQASGLNVGRMPNNDLQLDAQNVSRNHLRVALEHGRVMVTDLGSRSGTQLGDVMLPAQIATEWPFGQMLRVGSYWLRLDAPSAGSQPQIDISRGAGPSPSISQPDMPSMIRSFVSSGLITVSVAQELLTLIPGQSSSIEVTLTNSGQAADQLVLSVDGVPEEWVTLPPPVQVTANGQSTVRLSITVPEESSARTGEYPVEVRARSRTNHAEGGTMLVRWTVAPFLRASMSVAPARLNARKSGHYRVTLRNEGNAPVSYRLTATDEEGKLALSFGDDQVTIEPGGHQVVPLRAETGWLPLGSSENLSIEVRALSHDGNQNQVSSTVFVHEPVMPVWMGGIAGILFVLALAGGMVSGVFTGGRLSPTASVAASPSAQPAANASTAAVETTTALAVTGATPASAPTPGDPNSVGQTPGVQPGTGGTDPGNGGTQPGTGGTDPGGGTQPGTGGTDPGGGTQPGTGGTDPGGGTQPGTGGTDPGGGTQPGTGGTDPGTGGTDPGSGGEAPEAQTATAQSLLALGTATAQALQQAGTATAVVDQRATTVAATQTAVAGAGFAQRTAIAVTQTAEVLVLQQTQQALQAGLTATVVAQQAQATGTAQVQQTALVQSATGTALVQQTATAQAGQTATVEVQLTATAQAEQTAIAQAQQTATAAAEQTATAVAQITVPPTLLSPPNGMVFNQFPRTVTLVWDALPNAVRYTVEVQFCSPSGCAVSASPWKMGTTTATTYIFDFVGAQPGRWRVSATGTNNNPGPMSAWREFRFTQ